MNITGIGIDGFGVWSGLELQSLSPQLTVIYGANEAGKTTLLECLRGLLYGLSPARRQRYLPPVHGGQAGGSLDLLIDAQRYFVARADDGSRLLGGVTVTLPDGSTEGEPKLIELLHRVDERTFGQLFTVGLRELQELATLGEVEAGHWLYDLSTGLEGVSLAETLRELRNSRVRLIAESDEKSQVVDLLSQRDQLRGEIEELRKLHHRYWALAAERTAAVQGIAKAESELISATADLDRLDAALAIRSPWRDRHTVEAKIAAFGRLAEFPSDAVVRLQRLLSALNEARRRRSAANQRRRQLRFSRRKIAVNERLLRHAPRIAALVENEPWVVALEEGVRAAEAKVAKLERQLAEQQTRLALPEDSLALSADLANEVRVRLREPARLLRSTRKQLRESKADYQALRQTHAGRRDDLGAALANRGESTLSAALEKQGQLVAKYRRRLQLDDRLDQMALHREDLDETHRKLRDRQIVPTWLLTALAIVFVAGGGLVLAGLIIPWGTATAVVGALIAASAITAKKGWERSSARRLAAAEKQLKMLERQLQQAKAERDELDDQLPKGGGALASRLQQAEAELASLEELLSADSRRHAVDHELAAAKQKVQAASQEWNRAKNRWRQSLDQAGLPTEMRPGAVQHLLKHGGVLHSIRTQLEDAHSERERARRELSAVATRIEQLAAEAGWESIVGNAVSLVEQLRRLRRELASQEEQLHRRAKLDERLERLRRRCSKYARLARKISRRRRSLYRTVGAVDEQDFRRRAEQRAELDDLLRRRAELSVQIQSACRNGASEQDLATLLSASDGQLEADRAELMAARDNATNHLKRLSENCGRVAHEQSLLAADRRLPLKQLELSAIEERLSEAVSRWQTLAVTEFLIEQVKQDYERNRQPEVLQQASVYLRQMTEGRYPRVWTPLDERVLRVDDAEGRSLAVERLSTGAREQLFLCLRLALVSRYAKHGTTLPMVLDDVLVNFDKRRASAAAAVFVEYAAAGHQLLLFTCHEHIADLFRALQCDVRTLPSNADASPKILGPENHPREAAADLPRRRREKRSKDHLPSREPEADESAPAPLTVVPEIELPPPASDNGALAHIEFVPDNPSDQHDLAIIDHPRRFVEPPRPAVRQRRHRADPPQPIAPKTIRHRWSAEEFDGELEDQVNVALLNGNWIQPSA